MTIKKIISNSLIIACFASITLTLHYFINSLLNSPIDENKLFYSYTINVLMASGVITILFLLSKKFKDQLGFVFMSSSIFKFIAFFVLFYPEYNEDGELTRTEFFTFFIPYTVCLIVESVIVSKFLRELDSKN